MKQHISGQPFLLSEMAVHLWVVPLDIEDSTRQQLSHYLSPEEKKRASKFYFEHDRNHYIVARGVLRRLLAHYIDTLPEKIIFAYNEFGKPFVASPTTDTPVQFNLSHSDNWAVIGITRLGKIGVDIERVRTSIDPAAIGKRFFASVEVETLLAASEAKRYDIFFSCWTRKEAFIKAVGQGLTFSLQEFAVEPQPDVQYPKLLFLKGGDREKSRWKFFSFIPVEGFKGAAALFVEADIIPKFTIHQLHSVGEL